MGPGHRCGARHANLERIAVSERRISPAARRRVQCCGGQRASPSAPETRSERPLRPVPKVAGAQRGRRPQRWPRCTEQCSRCSEPRAGHGAGRGVESGCPGTAISPPEDGPLHRVRDSASPSPARACACPLSATHVGAQQGPGTCAGGRWGSRAWVAGRTMPARCASGVGRLDVWSYRALQWRVTCVASVREGRGEQLGRA